MAYMVKMWLKMASWEAKQNMVLWNMAKSQIEIEAERKRGVKPGLPDNVRFEDEKPIAAPQTAFTDDELRKLARDKLVTIITTGVANVGLLPAIRELLDRLDGKPAQAMQITGQMNVVQVNAQVRFVQPQGDKLIIDHVDNSDVIDN